MTEASLVPPTAATAEAATEEAPKQKVRRSKFADLYPDNMPLAVLVAENPKKEGSKAREMFEGYRGANTVGEARANGVTYQCIAYDVGRKFIRVG